MGKELFDYTGAKWCDCPACRPTHELLVKFGREEANVYL